MTGRPFRRGDIWTVDLEPVVGSEQGRARPALIIQNDIGNQYSPVLIVAAVTSGDRARFDVEVEVKARRRVGCSTTRSCCSTRSGRWTSECWDAIGAGSRRKACTGWTRRSRSAWGWCLSRGTR